MKKPLALIVGVTVALIALSGCMRIEYNVTLHPDDTASGSTLIAVQESALQDSGMTYDEVFSDEAMYELVSSFSNASVADYAEDGYVGKLVTFDDQALEDVITREGDEFVFNGSLINEADLATFEEMMGQPGYPDPEIRMTVTFPGAVSEHNGSLSGTTVTWETEALLSDEKAYARGSAVAPVDNPETPGVTPSASPGVDDPSVPATGNDSESNLKMWILIGALAAAAIALLWWGIHKSKVAAAATAAAAAAKAAEEEKKAKKKAKKKARKKAEKAAEKATGLESPPKPKTVKG